MTGKVLVTGASGFVASNVIGQLFEKGYTVIGTVRNQSKLNDLLQKYNEKLNNPKLEVFVIDDLAKEGAFDELFQKHKDIEIVLHIASPFAFGSSDDFDATYLEPAVDGTLNVLKSITKFAPQVKNVVITSSFAAIVNKDKIGDKSFVHTEEIWNPIEWEDVKDEEAAYYASKKLSEAAAWDFVKQNKPNFQFNAVTPPYIFGPQYFDKDAKAGKLNTSSEVINNLLKSDPNDTKLFKDLILLEVDVRDVAAIHILAFEKPGIGSGRLFACTCPFSTQSILNVINEKFPQLNGKIAKGQPEGADSLPQFYFDNSETVKKLGGYKFIPFEKTIVDTVNQIID